MAGTEIESLIRQLSKLPGLGPRSARRIALALIKRRESLLAAAEAMFAEDLGARVFALESDAARAFSDIAAHRRRLGKPISHADAQIAAIAQARGARLATRNAADFADCGVTVVDPWKGS